MSYTIDRSLEQKNPFSSPEKKAPSDYGSVEQYVADVTPQEFGYHCIEEAVRVARDPLYHDECMSHTAMGILYFAVEQDPYLSVAKSSREDLDDVCFEMDENDEALGLLKRLHDVRKMFHKHL